MRLFVAVDLDPAVRAGVAGLVDELRRTAGSTGEDLRWVDTDVMHLTLHFVGEVDEHRAGELATLLAAPYGLRPFDIALGGIGVFPPVGRVRVIWLGITEGAAGLEALHGEVGRRLGAAGAAVEARVYTPHVTLARARRAVRSAIRSRLRVLPATVIGRSRVAGVTLYESRWGPHGARYRPLAVGGLGG